MRGLFWKWGSGSEVERAQAVVLTTTAGAAVSVSAYTSSASFTRPNDTTPYSANDVIGAATGSTAAVEFAAVGPSGGEILIQSASYRVDVTSVPSGMSTMRLHLYSATPGSALGDNAAWDLPSGDRASYLGYVDIGTPVDLGSTLWVETHNIGKRVKLADGVTSLYGYLVTVGAFTPTAQAVKTIRLHTMAL